MTLPPLLTYPAYTAHIACYACADELFRWYRINRYGLYNTYLRVIFRFAMHTLYGLSRGFNMSMCKLIGVTGPAKSGKNTLCKEISNILSFDGYQVNTIAFADPIKDVCREMFSTAYNVPRTAWHSNKDQVHPSIHLTGREMMQRMGDGIRHSFPNLIMDYATTRINTSLNNYQLTLVSDVRFLNEAEVIRLLGGAIVKITVPQRGPMSYREQDYRNHISETEMASIEGDYVIHNDLESFDMLSIQAKDLLCEMEFLPST